MCRNKSMHWFARIHILLLTEIHFITTLCEITFLTIISQHCQKIGSQWLHAPSDMVSSAMTTWYNNNGLRIRVILDFVDQNVGWGTLHDILHVAKKETLRGGHFMAYYTSSKYYGRTRMHDIIVPWALRALGTKRFIITWKGSTITQYRPFST